MENEGHDSVFILETSGNLFFVNLGRHNYYHQSSNSAIDDDAAASFTSDFKGRTAPIGLEKNIDTSEYQGIALLIIGSYFNEFSDWNNPTDS